MLTSDTIRQYSLSTAFDLSSPPVAVKTFDIGSIQDAPQDMEFNSDGTIICYWNRKLLINRWNTSMGLKYTL